MRRFWMLLLAVVVVAALLVVPTMATGETHLHGTCTDGAACTACGQDHTGWTELPAGTTTISATGNYFLNADSVAAGITVTGDIEVTICLNGKVWTNPDSTTRPLYIKEGAKVNIVDCSNQSAISETDSTPVSAGSIQSTVDRSAESTGEAGYRTNTMGGAIYISGKSELNIYNGTIDGGYVYSGGAIYTTDSTLNIYGGHITGGKARTGGNIFATGSTLTVDGKNVVISGGTTTKKVAIENPDTTKKEEYDPNGGNIYETGGTMYLKAGVIRDGAAMGTAGNVRIGGVFNMSGGTIQGGIKITDEDTGAQNTTDGSANMQIVGAQSHVLSGGTITGHVTTYKTKQFTVSGDIVTGEVDEQGNATSGITLQSTYTSSGTTYTTDTKIVVGEAGLGENAMVAVGKTYGWVAVDKLDDAQKWAQVVEYFNEGKLRGYGNYKMTLEAADAEAEKVEALYIREANATGARYGCLCGANPGEPHIGECNAYAVEWEPYELTGSKALPTTVGYYYLVDKDGTADNMVNASRGDITNQNGIYVDFNGVKVTRNTSARHGNFYCTSTTAPTVVTFIDSSLGHTAQLVTACPTVTDHSNIWLRMSEVTDTKESKPTIMNCYRLTVDCSPITKTSGAGFVVGAGSFLNLYECHVTGGTTTSGVSSAITNDGGTVNVVGGSITGGYAKTNGGAIYNVNKKYEYKVDNVVKLTKQYYGVMTLTNVTVNGGEAGTDGGAIYNAAQLTMTGGKVNGGTAAGKGAAIRNTSIMSLTNVDIIGGSAPNGGAIYNSGAEATVTNCRITGGTVTTSGAGIYNEKNITLNNVTITGGTATTSGGAIYSKSGLLQATGCTFTGGKSGNNGGLFILLNNNATFDNCIFNAKTDELGSKNGAAIYVHGGNLTLENGTVVNGGEAHFGGAIYANAGTVTVKDSSINGGHAAEGGAVYIVEGATVNVENSTVQNGVAIRDCLGETNDAEARDELTIEDGKGANFFVAGTLNLTNTTVQGGHVDVYDSTNADYAYTYDSEDSDDYGGSALYVAATGEVTATGSFLYGYTDVKVYKRAGTIYNNGKITLTNTEVTATATHVDSAVIYNRYSTAQVTMTGGKLDATNLTGCAAYAAENKLALTYGATVRNTESSQFTLVSGDVYGFRTTATNGGAAVYNSATFTMQGGTIHGAKTNKDGIGGAVANNATFNMSGGTIIGGEAYNGGAVYTNGGTFTMSGGTIKDGKAAYGGNIYINKGTFNVTGANAVIQDGRAAYNAADRTDSYAYGGNLYMGAGTFKMTAGTVKGGTSIAKTTGTWSPGGNIYVNAGTLDIKNATVKDGQNTEAAMKQTSTDGNNLYINYDATVYLREGALIENTVNNAQENILVQGGKLYICGGKITAAEGVKGYNLRTNSSALNNKVSGATVPHFNNVAKHPYIEMTSGTISGATTNGVGANVYLDLMAEFVMTGGTIENGKALSNGANIYAIAFSPAYDEEGNPNAHQTLLNQYNEAKDPDVTAVDLGAKITIGGTAKIIGGTTTADDENGGSIYARANSTLIINGDAEIYGGVSANCGGNVYSNGYVTVGGNAKIYNGKGSSADRHVNLFVVNGFLTLQDNAQIAGGVCCTQNGDNTSSTVTLKDSPVIKSSLTGSGNQVPDRGLQVNGGIKLILDGLTADADIETYIADLVYDVDETSEGYIVGEILNGSVIDGLSHNDNAHYYNKVTIDEAEVLVLVAAENMEGVVVNGGGKVQSLDEAIASLGENDYITLINDRVGDTISKDIMLDLNGHKLTDVTLAEGVELKLFDAGSLDYELEVDENSPSGFSGYGVLTLSEDSKGTIVRQFNTPRATYGGNYRFVVIKDDEGYHAHRIYLTVKSTILYPNTTAMNYRTALRCDQLVAKYINAEGGGFGILVSTDGGKTYGDYTENDLQAKAWNAETVEENNLVTRLSNILSTSESDEVNTQRAVTAIKAQAYIFLADEFTGGKLAGDKAANVEAITAEAITSSGVNLSLQNMVAAAFAKAPTELSEGTQDALYSMYTRWSSVMSPWDVYLKHLQDYKDKYSGVNLKYACLCGDPNNERGIETPCSVAGHPQMTWREWDVSTGKLPGTTGNYYLPDDLVLTSQGSIAAGQYVNLNLNGHSINSTGERRIANVFGMFNLTNYGYDGAAVENATITSYGAPYYWDGSKYTGGNGGTLLISGNVSLYSGVTLQMAEENVCRNGVVEVSGDLNIYGGHIKGATLKNTYTDKNGAEQTFSTYGGAVNMGANAYLYMNSGSITGGTATYGGAIYANGKVELEGGTITAGQADDGAMFYVKGGELINRGVALDASAGLAKRGGLAFVADGSVVMVGTAEKKLNLTGGTTYSVVSYELEDDGSIKVENNKPVKKLNSKGEQTDNALNISGSGGVFYVAGGSLDLDHCVLNGSENQLLAADKDDPSRFAADPGVYSDDLDGHGGTVLYIADGDGAVTVDACELNGYVGGMANKRGGNVYMNGGSLTVDGDENVSESSTLNAGWSGVNSPVIHMLGGTFTMNEGTTLTAANVFAADGVLKNGVTYGGVVALAATKAEFNMNGGVIEGGLCKWKGTHGGGNVSVSAGTFNMTAGEIRGGVFKAGTATAKAGGGNVRLSGGTFNMSGGRITGGVDHTGHGGGVLLAGSSAVLNVSKTAYIYGNTDGSGKENNVYLESDKKVTLGALETGAKVGVTMASSGGTFTTDNTVNTAQALENGWLLSDSGMDTGLDAGTNQFYIGKYACVCGGLNDEHLDSCSKELQFWMPWTSTDHLPKEAGFWYLAYDEEELTISEQANIGVDATEAVHVVLDLNGKTVKRAEDGYNNRFYALNGAEGNIYTLTITDNSVGRKGKLVCANEGNGQGLGVWLNKEGSTLNLLAGTIDAGGKSAALYGGMAIFQEANTVVNMFGGAVIGGNTDKSGGAVHMNSGATFTMKDGTITGGTVKGDGGAIYMASGASFTMNGGTIISGHALCKQTNGDAKTTNVSIDGTSYTVSYTAQNCSDHGQGGAVHLASGATFTMNGGTVKAPENQTQRNGGYGGLFSVAGTFNMYDGTISGGSADGRNAPVSGTGTEVNHDCGYGGNIYISGGTMNMYGGTIKDGYTHSPYLPAGTYVKGEETVNVAEYSGAGGGLGGNICVSGTLNLYGGKVEGGIAETGGNIGTNSDIGTITLGAPADAQAPIDPKTVQILGGTAANGGNLMINVRPCESFVINEGTWIEGGHATSNGGNIAISPWTMRNPQYVQTGTDAEGNKTYATEYDALITMNGGTVTGGTANSMGGNVYLYGRTFTNSNTAYPKVTIYAKLNVGQKAVISDGAANSGNNLYLNSYGHLNLAGTVRNTLNAGDKVTVGEDTITVSVNGTYIGTKDSKVTLEATGSFVNEKAAGAETQPVMRNVNHNSGTFIMNGGSITGGYLTGATDIGANVLVNTERAQFTMNGGTISGGKTTGATAHGGNIYVNEGDFILEDGTISDGSTTGATAHGGNIYVNAATASLTMNGGTVSDGMVSGYKLYADTHANAGKQQDAAHGGNIFINSGVMTMNGGTVSNGICALATDTSDATSARDSQVSGAGGNIYVYKGDLAMKGEALVTGGKVAKGGGNIYLSNQSGVTFTMEGKASVTDGLSTRTNGGNIYVSAAAVFTMKDNASVTGGRSNDGGGNVYANGTMIMEGGTVSGGEGSVLWDDYTNIYTQTTVAEPSSTDPNKNNANLFFVGGGFNFQMSGGLVEGGVGLTNQAKDNTAKPAVISGTARITGNGLYLGNYGNGEGYVNPVDLTGLLEGGEIGLRSSVSILSGLKDTPNYVRITADLDDAAYVNKLVKEVDPNASQVAYLTAEEAPDGVGGIYLLNGSVYRYGCLCGANEGEEHLPLADGTVCDGTEVLWKPWSSRVLPSEPGNWYLTGLSTEVNEDGVRYAKLSSAGALKYDYYIDDEGNYVKLRALLERDENGALIQLENGSYKQATLNGQPVWLTSDGKSIAQIPEGKQVLDSYTIRLDLNGYKLQGPTADRNLTFYGRGDFTANTADYKALIDGDLKNYTNVVTTNSSGVEHYETHRQTPVNYTIIDSSEGHTAVLATYGRFSGQQRNTTSSPQGTNIWMPWKGDTLNTYRIVLDASNVKLGWGQALTVQGTANLYATEVIGGVSQAYYSANEEAQVLADDGETLVGSGNYVKTVGGPTNGGAAIQITETGVVNMYGGTIRDGIVVYRNFVGTNGVSYERGIGGGNVYVNGEFNVTGTATYPAVITGGKALNYIGDTDTELSSYSYAQGGGVYLAEGTMSVSGNVTITDNYTGTVGGELMDADDLKAADGTGLGIIEIDRESIVTTGKSNVFLNGNTMEAKNLTGNVGFSMIGTEWQGNFAKVDNGSTAYVTNGNLVPDVAQTATSVVYAEQINEENVVEGYLRYVAQAADTLQVGYGVYSIQPTQQDIANGLSLGGYGNSSYKSSKEELRMTRYWLNPDSTIVATDPNYALKDAPMQATAMAFRDTEGDTVIIINLDYNNVSDGEGNKIKQLISKRTGVSIDNITVSASHQHTGPSVTKQYWTDIDGNPTYSYEEAHEGTTLLEAGASISGTYGEIIYGNPLLPEWEAKRVRTDYYTTFYTGILNAAVMAYEDLAPVTSISAGIMDTTTGGNQFNFVRNVALYDASDKIVGMITDNHVTHYDLTGLSQKPESELDVTMQIVKYERADKTIVLTNFQSHPHLADGSNNLNTTGGVVYIFRDNLSKLYGTENKQPCQVLYFSGAGGNVNSSAKISTSEQKNLQPWYVNGVDTSAEGADIPSQRAIRALAHGTELAELANAFLADGKTNIPVDATTANVQVTVKDFEYTVWNEKQSYTVGSYQVPATWSDYKKQQAALLVNWEEGGYLDRPGKFNTTDKREGATVAYWYEFVGNVSEKNDKIYSFFHANGVRKRYLGTQVDGAEGTGHFEIKAYDLGGIGFVAAPYEMFQESGQAIKGNVQAALKASQPTKYANFPDYVTNGCGYMVDKTTTGQTAPATSPYKITIIASQTQGAQGYIPSVLGYVNGGYATDTTLFAPGTGEQLVTAYVDMLIGLNSAYTTNAAEGE